MNRFLRLALPLSLIVLLLLALGYWNVRPESFFEEAGSSSEITPEVDFYADNARTVQYLANGSRHYQLDAPHMKHFRSTGNSQVEQPDMLLHRGSALPWRIQSQHAEISDKGEQVELIDEVRIARTDARNRSTLMTTSRLSVFPARDYAETSRAVRIETASGVTTATGLQAYLKDGRMILQSSVRGQHEVR